MKDDERDRIDIEVKEFLQACMSQANRVKNLISSGSSINECELFLLVVVVVFVHGL